MPIRTAAILSGLFAACLAIAAIAWAIGSEFYLLLPTRLSPPPHHPLLVLGLLAVCLALFFYSQREALILFSVLLDSLVLGSIVGYAEFDWTPTVMQTLLTVTMIAETIYGWTIETDYLDD
ncbi:MAG: hypothetical protein GX621_16875 [Pirellulaceae bacterium]|nr:hypothetical protein [Pirellulaceae bacterium]